MKRVLFILLFIVLLIGVEKSLACSCIAPDPNKSLAAQVKEAYQNSSAVFSARVLSMTEVPEDGNKKVRLRLVKSWKGKLSKTVIIITGLGGGDCGYFFKVGKTYLIYAHRDENKKLSTNICTRTSETRLNKDIAVLDKLKKKI